MLDLYRLHLLRELSRRGTVTAVAQALSFSPSAISQQLATLEREAGTRLLEPAGRRLRLTPQGELLLDHADRLLAEMERAESALAAAAVETVGTLRVAAFQSAVLTLVPAALTRLQRHHPRLRVEVTELEPDIALPAMIAGDYDVVVAEEYPDHPLPRPREVERMDICADELLLVVPAGWKVDSLADLGQRAFAMEPPESPAGRWAVSRCREAGFEPDRRYTTTDLQIHLRLAQAGLAAALLPALSEAEQRVGLTVHRLPGRPHRRVLVNVRRGASTRPSVASFAAALGRASPIGRAPGHG